MMFNKATKSQKSVLFDYSVKSGPDFVKVKAGFGQVGDTRLALARFGHLETRFARSRTMFVKARARSLTILYISWILTSDFGWPCYYSGTSCVWAAW